MRASFMPAFITRFTTYSCSTMAAASHMSSCRGLPLSTALPMAGLEWGSLGSSEWAWFCWMVFMEAMPGRMLLRPPPKPAITCWVAAPRATTLRPTASGFTTTSVPRLVVPR